MALAIYLCLRAKGCSLSFNKLRFELQFYIQLTDKDKEVHETRAAELKWHGIMRNVKRTIEKNPAAFGGKLVVLKGGVFVCADVYAARKAKQDAIWGAAPQ